MTACSDNAEKKSLGEAEQKTELAFELADNDIEVKRECAEILIECGQLEKAEQGDAEQALFLAERARERLPENHTIREEFDLRYMEMIMAKHRGDLSRFEAEQDRVNRIANGCFAGNKRIVRKING